MQPSPKSKEQSAVWRGHPELVRHISETIRRDGPVSFAWFMEQALYHPQFGYYSSGRARIGRRGDYFTNVSVGPVFGQLMAAQFDQIWKRLGRPKDFVIVEQGGHDGDFARDVLEAARARHADFFSPLLYWMIEPFRLLRERQGTALKDFVEKVEWFDSLENLPAFRGVHFSNELVDAMPVHLLKWDGQSWHERHVDEVAGGFVFVDLPLFHAPMAKLPPRLPNECYETEINQHALTWIESLAAKITQGFVIIADYGFGREEFYAPQRTRGTLRCYADHRVAESPLQNVGYIDITAHVEWTSLIKAAAPHGLTLSGFADQHHFLAGLLSGGLAMELERNGDAKSMRQLQTLLHPEHMGTKFQFLVLEKNLPPSTPLSGLRFARNQV